MLRHRSMTKVRPSTLWSGWNCCSAPLTAAAPGSSNNTITPTARSTYAAMSLTIRSNPPITYRGAGSRGKASRLQTNDAGEGPAARGRVGMELDWQRMKAKSARVQAAGVGHVRRAYPRGSGLREGSFMPATRSAGPDQHHTSPRSPRACKSRP